MVEALEIPVNGALLFEHGGFSDGKPCASAAPKAETGKGFQGGRMRDLVSLVVLVLSIEIGRFVVGGWLGFCVGGDGQDVLVCDRGGRGVD